MKKLDKFILDHPEMSAIVAAISITIGFIMDLEMLKDDAHRYIQERDNK